ncbi:MAG: ABC transporter ATP-binding protein [Lawsonibacter sp.]
MNVYYGAIHAIKGVSFEVNEGEVVTLIGANGAGKSTILNTVSGLLSSPGSIHFDGQEPGGHPRPQDRAHGPGPGPGGTADFPADDGGGEPAMGAYTRPASEIEISADVYERFPPPEGAAQPDAGTLSGGEQQMLAMGRALMSKPKLLMLDEPSMGLAPILVEQIFDIVKRMLNKPGTTILLVEQNAHMALSVADRGYVLETGKIVTTGTGAELLEAVRPLCPGRCCA